MRRCLHLVQQPLVVMGAEKLKEMNMDRPKAVVIGATSGIGQALALYLAEQGYQLGMTGRRTKLLEETLARMDGEHFFRQMDVTDQEEAIGILEELISEMNGIDLLVINSGIGFDNKRLMFPKEKLTIDTNVSGFVAMAGVGYRHFEETGKGQIVGISSVVAVRGNPAAAYCASKAFVSNYMQGMRHIISKRKLDIAVTDIRPGFVDTPMVRGQKGMFWVATPEKAASQIYSAIKKKKTVAYITRRWRLMAWLLLLLPDSLVHKL